MEKKNVLSRGLALLLAVVMALSCTGITAFAAETKAEEPAAEQQADKQQSTEKPSSDESTEQTQPGAQAPETPQEPAAQAAAEPVEGIALLSAGSGLSAADPMAVSGEALVYDSAKGIVGFSKTWYDSLDLNGATLYVALTIPAEINGTPVTKIAYQALQYKNNGFRTETDVLKNELKNIKIVSVDFTQAANLTVIDQFAFDQRPELTGEIDLSNTKVTTIGAGAFRGTAITGVILPDGLKELGDVSSQAGAFAQCSSLTFVRTASDRNSSEAVVLPDGLTTIGKQCFRYSFTKGSRIAITIPASVEKIGAEAFNACGNGNYGEICQLNVMRTSDFSGYDRYAFQSKAEYPAIYTSKAAYDAAKSSSIRDGSGSATMTYVVGVQFKYNNAVIETHQKLYNMYLLYEKDASGIWSQNNNYALPVPEGTAAGMTVDWKYSSSGTAVSTEDKLRETTDPVVIVASKAVPATPVINGVLPDPRSVHEDSTITLSLDLAQLPEGMAYAYEWIVYDESAEDEQRTLSNDSTLTLTYEEAKGNYFAVGVAAYLLSDEEAVSEWAVYGWFTVSATTHSWPSDWTVDRQATANTDGLQHKTCTVANCGKTIWESIPATGSTSGNITKAVEIGPGAPQTELLNTRDELAKLLTEDEKLAVVGGAHARIWLEVQKLAAVPAAEAAVIEAKAKALLGDHAAILPFDISLYAQVDNQAQRKITETADPIQMALTVPEEVSKSASGMTRQWYLIRVHSGQVQQVSGEYNSQTGTLAFTANKFSTYAFVYADAYTVTFDGNGASGQVPASMNVSSGASFIAPNAGAMTKTGYHFTGWAKQADAQTADYPAGASVTGITANVTLYAVWTANAYQVVFHANGGTGTMQPQSFTYGDAAKALTTNAFTRTGYTFSGWATAPNGTVVYTDAQKVNDLTTEKNGSVTLYAVWTANDYQVVFHANGGTGTMQPQDFTYGDAAKALTANAFTRTGYTFSGWATEPNGTVVYTDAQQVKDLTTEKDGTVTLYAVWTANSYQVVFHANGGTGTMQPQSFIYGDAAKALTANALTRTGYTFTGWATEPNGAVVYTDAQQVKDLTETKDGTVTLYAVWTANDYQVVFHANGGTGTMQPQGFTYGDAAKALTANAFTRTGYTFSGWATEPNGAVLYTDAQQVKDLTTEKNGSVTLYAVWTANTYQVVFHANGGTGTMQPQGFTYGDATKALTTNVFTRTGYTFSGWATEPNGAVVYTDAQQVKDLTTEKDGTVTLYAVWTANAYQVVFHANGGTGTMQPQSFTYGDAAKALTTNAFTRTGYTFSGWATESNGTVVYTDAQKVKDLTAEQDGAVDLYAVWKSNSHYHPTTPTTPDSATTGETIKSPGTGDTGNLGLMAALMVVSAAGVLVLLRRKKAQN